MNVESLNVSTANGATTAYVARSASKVTATVLLIQEWWGLNRHIRDIAGRYADAGYLSLPRSLWGQGHHRNAEEASAMDARARH